MSDTYQAVYDAVRSRISNPGDAIERAAREAFDISFQVAQIKEAITSAAYAYERPSAIYRPKISLDGNMYCALYGEDLMSGCAGFGETMDAAMWDFDKNWREQKAPKMAERIPAGHHKCHRCGEIIEDGIQMDGCRDPSCPHQ
jgi:hypothetical protein